MTTKTKTKIQKISSKGQVTLPAAWRKAVKTDLITVKTRGNTLEISPAHIFEPEKGETIIFDALRDNNGQGLPLKKLQSILKKLQQEHG